MSAVTTSSGATEGEPARSERQLAFVTDPAATGQVWVVIVNYNTVDLLARCMRHLLASEVDRPLEVYIVDNGSADDSLQMLRTEYPHVRAIEAGVNLGFARANNLALREILALAAQSQRLDKDYVLLLNTDCFVEPDTLQQLARFLDTHPDAGIVGPKVLLPDGRLDLACRRSFPTPVSALWKLTGLARWFPHHRWFARYNLTYLDPDETLAVDAVTGACMLVRLEAVAQAGVLDEDYFMYGEDLDWAYRIKARGWRVYYHPRARATHIKGGSGGRRRARVVFEFYRAMYLFYRKHYARRSPLLLNLLIYTGIGLRGCLALVVTGLRRLWGA
jgi:GT2 family glycosyltransferase